MAWFSSKKFGFKANFLGFLRKNSFVAPLPQAAMLLPPLNLYATKTKLQ
jgi:hypothetical protein